MKVRVNEVKKGKGEEKESEKESCKITISDYFIFIHQRTKGKMKSQFRKFNSNHPRAKLLFRVNLLSPNQDLMILNIQTDHVPNYFFG